MVPRPPKARSIGRALPFEYGEVVLRQPPHRGYAGFVVPLDLVIPA